MPYPPMPTQIKCSNCGKTFIAQILSIVDVGEQPELKEQFLRGEVNRAQCPDCGTGGVLVTSLIYHDPDKELLVGFVPAEVELSADQREQLVGSLVQAVMNSVPAEQRKGYFLQPKMVLTLDSLYDTILEADGVSKKVLEAQRARLGLLSDLMRVVDDDDALDKLVEEHRATLDYGFFLVISDLIEARGEGDDQGVQQLRAAQQLRALREKLLERVNPVMPSAAPPDASYDDLVALLREATETEGLRESVALNRPRLDYGFFQALTAKIESAQSAGDEETRDALTSLRQRILEELDALGKLVQAAQDRATLLIMELLEAEDLAGAVQERLNEINDIFLALLARYSEAARAQDDEVRAAKLQAVMDATMNALGERLPPDLRLINRLLRADYPDGTSEVLEAHRGLLSDDLLRAYDHYIADLEQGEDEELLEHLRNVRQQMVAKMTILRA